MSSRYPPITPNEACKIAEAWGWEKTNPPRTAGDHRYYLHTAKELPLQIDMGEKDFGESYIRMMIKRMGITREQFYSATKKTAKKISVKYSPPSK